MFNVHMGVPEMSAFWNALKSKTVCGEASGKELRLYKQIGKAMFLLSNNPRHPGLQSHEIDALTARYGMKVWESYLENNTSGAVRIFWVYGPNQGDMSLTPTTNLMRTKKSLYPRLEQD